MTYRLLLDTSSMMFRAFFALPTSIRGEDGHPVNALHGYLDMVATLITQHRPDQTIHVYDHDWRPAPRVAAFSGYKATRQPDPEGLPEQFEVLRRVLDALGQPQAESEGWEAEDAIATMAASLRAPDRADVVSGDRDLVQVVRDPVVRLLFTRRGVTDLAVLDEAGVIERFGVPASRYVDFAILRGDPSDELPGVRGVGEKTARLLVQQSPSLPALLQDAESPKRSIPALQRSPSLRATLRDSRDYVEAMLFVVPVRTDLEVRQWGEDPDGAVADELAGHHRLTGPVRRLRTALEGPAGS
jgi:5'-3' exonuclease